MAITISINMTQRTRNHSVEFLLSVTATAVTRKVKLLYHHCLPLLGRDGVGGHGHRLLRKETAFPKTALQLGQLRIPSGTWRHGAEQRPHTQPHMRHCLLSSPEGWYWAKPTETTGRYNCSGDRGSRPNLLQETCFAEISAENNGGPSDPDVPAEALGTAGNNRPQCHFTGDTMMGNCQRKNRSCGNRIFVNRKMKAKGKTSPILWLIWIIFCSTCSLSIPCGSTLLLIADEWFLQSMGAPRDEQIVTIVT